MTRTAPRWSLQTRLIIAIVTIVALILVAIGVASAATLRGIVEESLNSRLSVAVATIRVAPGDSAQDTLVRGRLQAGTLLVFQVHGDPSGAYVRSDGTVVELDPDEVTDVVSSIRNEGVSTVNVDGLGEYRMFVRVDSSGAFYVLGLPTAEQNALIAKILTTVALLTFLGLLVLVAVLVLVIRRSLAPLREVADTAARVAALPMAEGQVSITERVPASAVDTGDEIGRVGAALNTLLDHVDTSLAARQRNEERMRAFVADASHELRTPLAAVRGYAELSRRTLARAEDSRVTKAELVDSAATSKQALERIEAASVRMTALVEDLLLLARLDEGKELVFGTVDLHRLLVESVTDAQVAGPDHVWEIDADAVPIVVAGDQGRLHQVVANLLTNARVHTPAGTRVTAEVTRDGSEAVVRISDDGPGITPDAAAELFERFARADLSRARRTGGTGLGLSIAKAIVTGHGGAISVDSAPGRTVFEVRLPARPVDPQEQEPHSETEPEPDAD